MAEFDKSNFLGLLKLNDFQIDFFESLVALNKTESSEEKEKLLLKLNEITENSASTQAVSTVTQEFFELYTTWYHQVIRSLIDLYEFKGDFEWLAGKVFPEITSDEARSSVELLVNLGMIELDEQGVYRASSQHISTGREVPKETLKNYYETSAKMAIDSISTVDKDKRNISGLTLGVSEQGYKKIVQRLEEFRHDLVSLADKDEQADRVYNVTLLCFPESNVSKEL